MNVDMASSRTFVSSVSTAPYYVTYDDPQQTRITINVGDSLNLTGSVNVMIPRDICDSISYMCVDVSPGEGSSYSLADGTAHIYCFTVATQVNCDGEILHALRGNVPH